MENDTLEILTSPSIPGTEYMSPGVGPKTDFNIFWHKFVIQSLDSSKDNLLAAKKDPSQREPSKKVALNILISGQERL